MTLISFVHFQGGIPCPRPTIFPENRTAKLESCRAAGGLKFKPPAAVTSRVYLANNNFPEPSGQFLKVTLLLLFAQMAGMYLPLAFFPREMFKVFLFIPTLEGQYIIKNLVLVSAGLVIGATVRGGALIHDAGAAQTAEHTQTLHRCFHREP